MNMAFAGTVLGMADHAFLTMGKRTPGEKAANEHRALARNTGQITQVIIAATWDGLDALRDGHLEEVIDTAKKIRSQGEEAGIPAFANIQAGVSDIRAQIYLGRSLEALEPRFRVLSRVFRRPAENSLLCLVLAHLGRMDEASEILDQEVVKRPGGGSAEDERFAWVDSLYLEAAVLTGHRTAGAVRPTRFVGTWVLS